MNLVPARAAAKADVASIEFGGTLLHVHGYAEAALRPFIASNRPLLFGVRPEDCFISDPDQSPIAGQVKSIESLGAETILTIAVEGGEFLVRGGREAKARPGECIGLLPDKKEVHLFDPETGRALARAAEN